MEERRLINKRSLCRPSLSRISDAQNARNLQLLDSNIKCSIQECTPFLNRVKDGKITEYITKQA